MASSLTRWDPAADFAAMRNAMDRFFERGPGRFPAAARLGEDFGPTSLSLDVIENPESFVVKAAVPGVDPGDVEITIEDDILTIKGESSKTEETKEDNYLRREIRFGSFQRQLRLPPTVDADNATAEFTNGILNLTLPKKPESRARSLKITPKNVIEGEKPQSN